jgi:type II secretory pathway pseudopilin PulG
MNRAHRQSSAFTLVEVLLAVTLLGLLTIAVASTWSAGLKGWKQSTGLAENLQRQRIILDAITELTQAAIYNPERRTLYAVRNEHDLFQSDTISFVTASDALLPQSQISIAGLRRVTFRVNRDDNPGLVIENSPALQDNDHFGQHDGLLLARDVTALKVRFRDAQNGIWKEIWSNTDEFPDGIEFTLAFAPIDARGKQLIVSRLVEIPTARFMRQPPNSPVTQ